MTDDQFVTNDFRPVQGKVYDSMSRCDDGRSNELKKEQSLS
jgi:hypothetical protein